MKLTATILKKLQILNKNKKIIISANSSWNIYNFRRELICELENNNYQIVVVSPKDKYTKKINGKDIKCINIKIDRKSIFLLNNLITFITYIKIFFVEKPNMFLSYTIKPTIIGTLASLFFPSIKVYNNITGLGTFFFKRNLLYFIILFFYKIIFFKSTKVFFQNSEDLKFFINNKIIKKNKSFLINGSGVNTEYFYFKELNKRNKTKLIFVMISRLIWDKGIKEYVYAAEEVKKEFPNIKFYLLGDFDNYNKSCVDSNFIDKYVNSNYIEHYNFVDDVRPYIINSDCVVLPSYREGTSKILLEAASMGRPIITSNVSGCNNIVENNINGYLCEKKNIKSLVDCIIKFINLEFSFKKKMSRNGRKKIMDKFDSSIINKKIIKNLNF